MFGLVEGCCIDLRSGSVGILKKPSVAGVEVIPHTLECLHSAVTEIPPLLGAVRGFFIKKTMIL